MNECPNRFSLLAWDLGDLDAGRAATIEAHVQQCAACRTQLSSAQQEAAPFAQDIEQHVARLKSDARLRDASWRAATTRTARSRAPIFAWGGLIAAGALAVVGLLWLRMPSQQLAQDPLAVTHYKGRFVMGAVMQRGGEQRFVKDGQVAFLADRLRFVLTSDAPGYVTVFSVDSAYDITPLYPQAEPRESPAPRRVIDAGREVLPGSVILDQPLGPETFVAVFSPESFDRGPVHRRVAQLLSKGRTSEVVTLPGLGKEGQVMLFTLRKRAPEQTP